MESRKDFAGVAVAVGASSSSAARSAVRRGLTVRGSTAGLKAPATQSTSVKRAALGMAA